MIILITNIYLPYIEYLFNIEYSMLYTLLHTRNTILEEKAQLIL